MGKTKAGHPKYNTVINKSNWQLGGSYFIRRVAIMRSSLPQSVVVMIDAFKGAVDKQIKVKRMEGMFSCSD